MEAVDLSIAINELKTAIDGVIDNFNNGIEFTDEMRLELLLFSAKLDAFCSSVYNINY